MPASLSTSPNNVMISSSLNSPMKQSMATAASSSSSQNITESVPVPSSEHVAEIVGRQGCKIKVSDLFFPKF